MVKKKRGTVEDTFSTRRSELAQRITESVGDRQAIAVVFSGEEQDLSTFSPDPNFYYLTGITSPKSAAFFHFAEGKHTQILLLPAPDPASERWTGKVLTCGMLGPDANPDIERLRVMEQTKFQVVGPFHQIEDYLARPLRSAEIMFLALPDEPAKAQLGLVQLFAESIKRRYPAIEIRNLSPMIAGFRRIKDAGEISLLKKAVALTDEAMDALSLQIAPGRMEYELQAVVEYVFKAGGAESSAFPSIIGAGPNSCVLHYNQNRGLVRKGDTVVCDIGAHRDMYCADVTRTFPASGKFSRRQAQVYQAVLGAHAAAVAAAKPGVLVRDIHRAAAEVIEREGFSRHFFHGTSHYLGLQAHDCGSYDATLEPGCVITVEPGIYVAPERIGVRIEDDILITDRGCEVLSSSPKEIRDIERALARPRKRFII